MALTILVTPAAGDIIQSSVWINEFNNIYNNPISLISPLTATVNLNSQTLSGAATFSGAITFSSTIAVTGAATFDGAVTLGNAAADNIAITGTVVSNLIFTDATYDIGASGATRPRDIHLSRNAIIGSTIELGHATDTTLARVSAGVASVEGDTILLSTVHNVAAAVHGLPASVNVLGNRAAAGEFIQRGNVTAGTTGGDVTVGAINLGVVTFAVAFSATPVIACSGRSTASIGIYGAAAYSLTTTGFSAQVIGEINTASMGASYIAVGT